MKKYYLIINQDDFTVTITTPENGKDLIFPKVKIEIKESTDLEELIRMLPQYNHSYEIILFPENYPFS